MNNPQHKYDIYLEIDEYNIESNKSFSEEY